MALFHLLHDSGYPFEAAHLDHGWRKGSEKESLHLEELCRQKKILFHTSRLAAPLKINNLEEQGRDARLLFFKEIVQRH